MTEQEIRDNAPQGANYYYQCKNGNVIYFKYFAKTGNLYRMTPNWCGTEFTIDRLKPL